MNAKQYLSKIEIGETLHYFASSRIIQVDIAKHMDDYARQKTKPLMLIIILLIALLLALSLSGCKTCEPIAIHDTVFVNTSSSIVDTTDKGELNVDLSWGCDSFYRPIINELLWSSTNLADSIRVINGKLMIRSKGKLIYRTMTDTIIQLKVKTNPIDPIIKRQNIELKDNVSELQNKVKMYRNSAILGWSILILLLIITGVLTWLKMRKLGIR